MAYFKFQNTSIVSDMSDKTHIGFFTGNYLKEPGERMHKNKIHLYATRLVEETAWISVAELRRIWGKKKLLAAIRDAQPIPFQFDGNRFPIYLTFEPHRLPGKFSGWSSIEHGNVRIYLACPRCWRRVRKLYYVPGPHLEPNPHGIACRMCHELRYMSQHSSNRKWWRNVAMPLKRIILRRERILSGEPNARALKELERINQSIFLLRNRVRRSNPYRGVHSRPLNSSGRRTYKDIDLILGNAGLL